MILVVRLVWTEPSGGDRALGFDVGHDLAELVVAWRRLRASGRRPRLRLERGRAA